MALGPEGALTLNMTINTPKYDTVDGVKFGCKVGATYTFHDPDEAADQLTFPGCSWYVYVCGDAETCKQINRTATFGSLATRRGRCSGTTCVPACLVFLPNCHSETRLLGQC